MTKPNYETSQTPTGANYVAIVNNGTAVETILNGKSLGVFDLCDQSGKDIGTGTVEADGDATIEVTDTEAQRELLEDKSPTVSMGYVVGLGKIRK